MILLITKQQINKYERLSENIADDVINPHILDAQEYDVEPVLPNALLNAIAAVILAKPQQWNKNKTYATDNVVWFGEPKMWYKATAANTNSEPGGENEDWGACELMNFYEQYLVRFLSFKTCYRFIADHGINITQFGVREMVEDSSREISDRRRGAKLGDLNSKANLAAEKISKALAVAKDTFDGVKYTADKGETSRPRPKVNIYQVGGRNKNCNRKWDCQ